MLDRDSAVISLIDLPQYFLNRGALDWGARYAYFWAAACFVSAAWVLMFLPELRDRTFEEIDEMVSLAWHLSSNCAFPRQAEPEFVLVSRTTTGQEIPNVSLCRHWYYP